MRLIDEVFTNINKAKQEYVVEEDDRVNIPPIPPRQTRTAPHGVTRKPPVDARQTRRNKQVNTKDANQWDTDKVRPPGIGMGKTLGHPVAIDPRDDSIDQELNDYIDNESSDDFFTGRDKPQNRTKADSRLKDEGQKHGIMTKGPNFNQTAPSKGGFVQQEGPNRNNLPNKAHAKTNSSKSNLSNDATTKGKERDQSNNFKKKPKPSELGGKKQSISKNITDEPSRDHFIQPDFGSSEENIEDLTEGQLAIEDDEDVVKVRAYEKKLPEKSTNLSGKPQIPAKTQPKILPKKQTVPSQNVKQAPTITTTVKPKPQPPQRPGSIAKKEKAPPKADIKPKVQVKPSKNNQKPVQPASKTKPPQIKELKKFQSQGLNDNAKEIEEFGEFNEDFNSNNDDIEYDDDFAEVVAMEDDLNLDDRKESGRGGKVYKANITKLNGDISKNTTKPESSNTGKSDSNKETTIPNSATPRRETGKDRSGTEVSKSKLIVLREQQGDRKTLRSVADLRESMASMTHEESVAQYIKNGVGLEEEVKNSRLTSIEKTKEAHSIVQKLIANLNKAISHDQAHAGQDGVSAMRYRTITKDGYRSFDGTTMTSTILNIDIEELSYCYAKVVLKHIDQFKTAEDDLQQNDGDDNFDSSMDDFEKRIGKKMNSENEESGPDDELADDEDGVKLEESNLLSQSINLSKNNSVELNLQSKTS